MKWYVQFFLCGGGGRAKIYWEVSNLWSFLGKGKEVVSIHDGTSNGWLASFSPSLFIFLNNLLSWPQATHLTCCLTLCLFSDFWVVRGRRNHTNKQKYRANTQNANFTREKIGLTSRLVKWNECLQDVCIFFVYFF